MPRILPLFVLFGVQFSTLAAITRDAAAQDASKLPPAVDRQIDFESDVRPLIERRCLRCHGRQRTEGELRFEGADSLTRGGSSGPAVVVGSSADSLLIQLVAGLDADRVMPAEGNRLSAEEIGMLRAWIDQGLKWKAGFQFGQAAEQPHLALRRAAVSGEALLAAENPVDRLLAAYWQANKLEPPSPADDRRFMRRAYLDVLGVLPTPAEIDRFVNDPTSDKRSRLIDQLLADNQRYAQHWLSFWNDALRNDYRGTGYIDGGRKQITGWLYRALAENMPFDRFVGELIHPSPEAEGFIRGIVWRGVVNASQRPEVQAAQNVAQVFLGINLKCASCHDSFINHWKLADSYGLAGVFADGPLEMHRCDRGMGEQAPIRFLYPELGSIDASASRDERLKQLAQIMTSPENGRVPRTMVNRLWARLLGRGLVEPLDDMDQPAWNPDLLDWLATDLVDHQYNLKRTLAVILNSRAYQSEAVVQKESQAKDFVFRGPAVRRMAAEQFVDAVCELCQAQYVAPSAPAETFLPEKRDASDEHSQHSVRFASGVINKGSVQIDVDMTGATTLWLVVTDGQQGQHYDWANWCDPELIGTFGARKLTELTWRSASTGYGKVQIGKNVTEKPLRVGGQTFADGIGTHAFSVIAYDLPEGTTRFRATAGPDSTPVEKGESGHEMEFMVLTDVTVRASLAAADPLMTALGRPNREQVVTNRNSTATTLEALELTLGATLDALVEQGARHWVGASARAQTGAEGADGKTDAESLVRGVFRAALGREPTEAELSASVEQVGSPVTAEGVQDLLWAIIMLPEFQLIY